MSLSLYRKYRPQTFSEVIGQKHIVQTLTNAIASGRLGHAYLFTGPRGTGKTTFARILARAVNCKNPKGADPCLKCDMCKNISEGKALDVIEIDAASNTGVDNIRELRENVKFPPSQGKFKVYIIDEVHMLSTGAFNALLKTLEEPPAHVMFILATTEIHKVPETIISRCQRFDFTRLSLEHIIEKLSIIAKSEDVKIEKDAIEMIAIAAEGGMRDAESLFSQIIASENKNITAKEVENILGTTKRQSLEEMATHLLNKNASDAISLVSQLSADGYDLEVFNKSLLNFLRQLMLLAVDEKLANIFSFELTTEQAKSLAALAKGQDPKNLLFIIQCFSEIQGKIKSSFIPQLPLEMATVKSTQEKEILQVISQPKPAAIQPIQPRPIPAQSPVSIAPIANQEPKIAPISTPVPKSDTSAPIRQEAPKDIKLLEKSELILNEAEIADPDFGISDVKKHWNQFISEVKNKNYSLSAFLQSCQPLKAEAGIITIATKFPFHKDKLNEYGSKLTLEDTFGRILGLRLFIKVITAQEAGITIASSLNQPSTQNSQTIASETSSLLNDAMGMMGGRLVGDQGQHIEP